MAAIGERKIRVKTRKTEKVMQDNNIVQHYSKRNRTIKILWIN